MNLRNIPRTPLSNKTNKSNAKTNADIMPATKSKVLPRQSRKLKSIGNKSSSSKENSLIKVLRKDVKPNKPNQSITTKSKSLIQPARVSKRLASKLAALKVKKTLQLCIERCPELEEMFNKKIEVQKPKDLYEFVIDPNEEKIPKSKIKKGHLKRIPIEDSGDENNSMKEVMQKLRKQDRKKTQTILRRNKIIKDINEPKRTHEMINKTNENNEVTKKINVLTDNVKSLKSLQEEISDSFMGDDDNYEDDYISNDIENVFVNDKTFSSQSEKKHVRRDEKTDVEEQKKCLSTNKSTSPKLFNIISDVRKSINLPNKSVTSKNIYNSTMNSVLDLSNPWRLNISNINKNPYTFTVKDKSFIPNYDQDIVINNTLLERVSCSEKLEVSKKNDKKVEENKSVQKTMYQSSMLNFVKNSKHNSKREILKAGGIFEDVIPIISPRKALGEITFIHSTPANPKGIILRKSPNISNIDTADISQDERNEISNLFGFSMEDSENIDPKKICYEKVRKTQSPKKKKLKTVFFNNKPDVITIDEPPGTEEKDISISPVDVNILFKDLKENRFVVKKSRRSYERMRPKRRRLPSVESIESDNDLEELEVRVKEKIANKRTKKEEEEAEKLAMHYNSMFQEIEQHTLCID